MKSTIVIAFLFLIQLQGFSQLKSSLPQTNLSQSFELTSEERFVVPNHNFTKPVLSTRFFARPPAWSTKSGITKRTWYSSLGFVVPIGLAFGLDYAGRSSKYGSKYDEIAGPLLLFGTLGGASLGYYFTGEQDLSSYGNKGILLRLGVAGIAALASAVQLDEFGFGLISFGGILLLNIHDIIALPTRLRRQAMRSGFLDDKRQYDAAGGLIGPIPTWQSDGSIRRHKIGAWTSTFIPAILGGILISQAIKSGDNLAVNAGLGTTLFTTGLLFGPSVGYFGTGEVRLSEYALDGILKRIKILGLTMAVSTGVFVVSAYSIGYGANLTGGGTLAVGLGILLYNVIDDIDLIQARFRAHSSAVGLTSLSVRPAVFYAGNNQMAAGINIRFKF